MATVLDRTVQSLTDVTGIIVDRTVTPEKVIGQAWVISKSRLVVLASVVSNYSEAPWALLVKFPYPDLTFAVKAISLHPEFNKRAAREHYLSQANELLPQALTLENDIATITIDTEIPDLQPDRVQELTRALSLPLQISAQDLSGVARAGEAGNILQKALQSGRNGVLNFYDERKVPFCRILIKGGRIIKASFQNLQNEFAVCELMWRKPGGNFVLQSNESLSWGAIPEIGMSTDQLANEANRRCQDLPRMLDALGGPNCRYVKTRQQIDLNQINQQIRWVAERVWPALDGGLPISKLSERLAVDTYTAVQALWEMKHLGLVAQAQTDQFHRSGQVGGPLTPGHEIDLKFWDNLQAFYLDDLSNLPVILQGNYFGSTHLLINTQLLHTMPMTYCKYGAVVLKDGRLVAVHNGKFTANLQNPPPFPLYQMTWIGSLSDMSAKRMRSTAAELDADGTDDLPTQVGRGTMTGLKPRAAIAAAAAAAAEGSASATGMEAQSPFAPPQVSTEPEILQKFTKIQTLAAGGAVGLLIGMILACMTMGPKPATTVSTQPPPVTTPPPTGGTTDKAAEGESNKLGNKVPDSATQVKLAVQTASFKNTSIPPFEFTDTTKTTAPKPSFGLECEQNNQKILFVVWPNASIADAIDSNVRKPPFVGDLKPSGSPTFDMSSGGAHDFAWKATHYITKDNLDVVGFVGAFSSTQPDKSILVVALPYKGSGELDYKNTINTINRMFTETGASDTGSSTNPETGGAADESANVADYIKKTGEAIKAAYRPPSGSDRANKCVVNFIVDPSGSVSKLELKYSSGMEDVDKAVQKAITSKVPFSPPPRTKDGKVPIQVTVESDNMEFAEQ